MRIATAIFRGAIHDNCLHVDLRHTPGMKPQIIMRLMRRGMTLEHPGFAAAYEREAAAERMRTRQDAALRVWARLHPRHPFPALGTDRTVPFGSWTAAEAREHHAVRELLAGHLLQETAQITVTWTEGDDHLVITQILTSGYRHRSIRRI